MIRHCLGPWGWAIPAALGIIQPVAMVAAQSTSDARDAVILAGHEGAPIKAANGVRPVATG